MTLRFEGRVAMVSGSASGIGRQSAVAFARDGATVIVADVDEAGARQTIELIEEGGGQAEFIRTDVTNEESVVGLIDTIIERHGRLDFAHNNAGIGYPPKPVGEMSLQDWYDTVDIHMTSVFLTTREQLRVMEPAGRGVIINASSGAGINAVQGLSGYCAAKHGVIGFTKTVAVEYAAKGIRVNAVAPGAIQTPLIDNVVKNDPSMMDFMIQECPMKRIGLPEEIANAVVFLCSDEASFITGATLAVDGGRTAY